MTTVVQPVGFHAAFYRGTHSGLPGVYNRLVRWWDRGPYSHCELVFSDGLSASSSFMDKGVRFKRIYYNPDRWDFIHLPQSFELSARNWFQVHEGDGYDVMGNLRFVIDALPSSPDKWFCDEALLAALGLLDGAWRLSPNGAAAVLRFAFRDLQPK